MRIYRIISRMVIGFLLVVSVPLAVVSQESTQDPEITIRYGRNITENMAGWISIIQDSGVTVVAVPDYEDPNCVAVIHDGKIRYRFTDEMVGNGMMAMVAEKLAKDENISRRSKSDCPEVSN